MDNVYDERKQIASMAVDYFNKQLGKRNEDWTIQDFKKFCAFKQGVMRHWFRIRLYGGYHRTRTYSHSCSRGSVWYDHNEFYGYDYM